MKGFPSQGAHVVVEDAAATLERGRENGSRVALPVTAIGDAGTMAVLSAPADASIGLSSPQDFPGFRTTDELNAPRRFELHTRKFDDSLLFYREVFHWDLRTSSHDSGSRSSTANDGEFQFTGPMDVAGHFRATDPSAETVYFGVASVDEAQEVVLAQGGRVLRSAQDSLYGCVATFRDPSGATI